MPFPTSSPLKFVLTAGLATIVATTAAGCQSTDPGSAARWGMTPTTATNASPPAVAPPAIGATTKPGSTDYSRLLLTPADVSIPPDTFTASSSNANLNGAPGASAFFVNTDDTKAIADTILIYPEPATATATLRQAATAVSTIVTGGPPQPFPVGSDGTIVTGTSPDGAKAVTLLLFTEGRALVRLEFDSAPGEPASPQVVTSVGTMQEIALRVGLPSA
jgi:hypothetical protein